jgi:hypothetical protein
MGRAEQWATQHGDAVCPSTAAAIRTTLEPAEVVFNAENAGWARVRLRQKGNQTIITTVCLLIVLQESYNNLHVFWTIG